MPHVHRPFGALAASSDFRSDLTSAAGQQSPMNIFKHPDDAPVTAFLKSPCTPDCLARAPISVPASYLGLYPGSKYHVTLIVQQGLHVVHTSSQQVFKTDRVELGLSFSIQLNFVIPPFRETGHFSVGTSVYDLSPGNDVHMIRVHAHVLSPEDLQIVKHLLRCCMSQSCGIKSTVETGLNEEDRLLTKSIMNLTISGEILAALPVAAQLNDNEDSAETHAGMQCACAQRAKTVS